MAPLVLNRPPFPSGRTIRHGDGALPRLDRQDRAMPAGHHDSGARASFQQREIVRTSTVSETTHEWRVTRVTDVRMGAKRHRMTTQLQTRAAPNAALLQRHLPPGRRRAVRQRHAQSARGAIPGGSVEHVGSTGTVDTGRSVRLRHLGGARHTRTDRRFSALFSMTMRAFCTRRDEHSAPVVLRARSARFAFLRAGSDLTDPAPAAGA